jgi:hypothetical protein
MTRCCCVSGHQIVDWMLEVLVGSGRVKGWMKLSVRTLGVHLMAHVASVGSLGPCRNLRSLESGFCFGWATGDLLFDSDSYRLVPYWDGRRKPSELLDVSECSASSFDSRDAYLMSAFDAD